MQSRTQYCCETWGAWKPRGNKVILQRLQAVCNKFFRLIYNLDRCESVRDLLKTNNVLNINQMYDYSISKTMHRARQYDLPLPLQNLFEISCENESTFVVSPSRIKRTENSISKAGPKVWNSLPNRITAEIECKKFQTSLKKHILNITP